MAKTDDKQKLLQILLDMQMPAEARADLLIFTVNEQGIDTRPAVAQLVKDADMGRALKAKMEEEEDSILMSETFIAHAEFQGRPFAVVTSGGSDVYVPCKKQKLDDLVAGDRVLVDSKTQRVVGADGAVPPTGDVVAVESVQDAAHVVVKHHDQLVKARLAQRLRATGVELAAGQKVVFNPNNRFVYEVIETEIDGEELVTPTEELAHVSRAALGAPNAILDAILFRMKMWVDHPEWMTRMGCRPRMSYLFVGPTGTGKTFHLKVLARELAEYVETLTGQFVSRLVMCDASSFYTPLFGETEQRISTWFEKLHKLGSEPLIGRDGEPVHVPILVVLEEAEALLRTRGEMGGSSHLFDRPLALMLQKLDALTDQLNVPLLFVATTNRPDLIDPAARRRFSVTQVTFGTLSAAQAASVLTKKITAEMPLRIANGQSDAKARQQVVNQVLSYLFGNDPEQGLAEVVLRSNERRTLNRRDVITPAMLENAVSAAIDEALKQSHDAQQLLGLDGEAVIRALQAQFVNLAGTLRPYNVREHCPEWFTDESIHIDQVVPLVRRQRKPRSIALQPAASA